MTIKNYNAVKTPRFYVDIPQWLTANEAIQYQPTHSLDLIYGGWNDRVDIYNWGYANQQPDSLKGLCGLNPSNGYYINREGLAIYTDNDFNALPGEPAGVPLYYHFKTRMPGKEQFFRIKSDMTDKNKYIAILGHNFRDVSDNVEYSIRYLSGDNISVNITNDMHHLVNANTHAIQWNGFTMMEFDTEWPEGKDSIELQLTTHAYDNMRIGAISLGTVYDMTKNPELNLTFAIEYENKTQKVSYQGSSISNNMWISKPMWGKEAPWSLRKSTTTGPPPNYNYDEWNTLRATGRRTWTLSFKYLDEQDVFGPNQSMSHFTTGATLAAGFAAEDIIQHNIFAKNLFNDDNFFSQVWNKTLGGQLPFIFQPDNQNFAHDGFALCIFDSETLRIERAHYNVYDISVKIVETW